MAFESTQSGIAASIFLGLYSMYLGLTISIVIKEGWKSMYSMLLIFGVLRVVGQISAVSFATLGLEHWQWLIAYLVFSAEGYFVLVLSSFRFLTTAQIRRHGTSWIRPTKEEIALRVSRETTWWGKMRARHTLSYCFHLVLIPANALVISGGSMLAGIDANELAQHESKITASKALRTSGQSMFLAETVVAMYLVVYCMWKEDVRDHTTVILCIAAPFLLVRGVAGVLAIYIKQMNYYDMRNYTTHGLSLSFVIYEYTLTATMEFVTGMCLILNYYFEQRRKQNEAKAGLDVEKAKAPSKCESSSVSD